MLKFYYTGATAYKATQSVQSSSLGGFISDTAIPNDIQNSLFTNLGELRLWNSPKITEYIGIAGEFFFFNEEELFDDITFKLKFVDLDAKYQGIFSYKIGLGPIGGNQSQGFYMEQISQIKAKPYYLTEEFVDLLHDTAVTFSKVSTTSAVGIWISRTFNPAEFENLFGENSDFWLTNNNLPELAFNLSLEVNTTPWIDPNI